MRRQSKSQIVGREGERWFESVLPPEWSIQRPFDDFGLDGIVAVGNSTHITPYEFGVQIKSSSQFNVMKEKVVVPKISRDMLLYWGTKFFPTLLIAYDTTQHVGYFEWVGNLVDQRDFESNKKQFYLHIPRNQVVDSLCWDRLRLELQEFHREFTNALLGARQIVPLAFILSTLLRNLCASQLADLSDKDQHMLYMLTQGWTHIEVVKELDKFLREIGSHSVASNNIRRFRDAYVEICRKLYRNFDELYQNLGKPAWIMMKNPPESVPILNELTAMLSDCVSGLLGHVDRPD